MQKKLRGRRRIAKHYAIVTRKPPELASISSETRNMRPSIYHLYFTLSPPHHSSACLIPLLSPLLSHLPNPLQSLSTSLLSTPVFGKSFTFSFQQKNCLRFCFCFRFRFLFRFCLAFALASLRILQDSNLCLKIKIDF